MDAITQLPPEILKEILNRLNGASMLRCSLACRCFNTLIRETSELQYILEMDLAGMVANSSSGGSYAERLTWLRNWRTGWATLNWKASSVVKLTGLCHAYEFVGGVFVKAIGGRDFVASWLSSGAEGNTRQLHRDNLQLHTRDFAMDPGQDLIVFIGEDGLPSMNFNDGRMFQLHLRTISTHEKHPKATYPTLQFFVPPSSTYGTFVRSILLQIADDVVAVLLSTGYYRLLIWNWRTGFLISDSALPGHALPARTADFSFISSRAYILTTLISYGEIRVISFQAEPGRLPIHRATLSLPQMRDGVTLERLSTHTGPFETAPPDRPFIPSPDTRVHVLSAQYDLHWLSFHYRLFVQNRTFLSYISDRTGHITAKRDPIDWDSWGPEATRMLEEDIPFSWLRYTHGSRVALPQDHNAPVKTLQVLDFSAHASQTSGYVFEKGVARRSYLNSSIIQAGGAFQNNVETKLPYISTTRIVPEQFSAYMLDGERIIGLKAEGHGDEELKELHVFTF